MFQFSSMRKTSVPKPWGDARVTADTFSADITTLFKKNPRMRRRADVEASLTKNVSIINLPVSYGLRYFGAKNHRKRSGNSASL
jgi:hypothetical protein